MSSGDRKKGREKKKPKQAGGKGAVKSDYQTRQSEIVASPYQAKRK